MDAGAPVLLLLLLLLLLLGQAMSRPLSVVLLEHNVFGETEVVIRSHWGKEPWMTLDPV
jgi:hypothetical protein